MKDYITIYSRAFKIELDFNTGVLAKTFFSKINRFDLSTLFIYLPKHC